MEVIRRGGKKKKLNYTCKMLESKMSDYHTGKSLSSAKISAHCLAALKCGIQIGFISKIIEKQIQQKNINLYKSIWFVMNNEDHHKLLE